MCAIQNAHVYNIIALTYIIACNIPPYQFSRLGTQVFYLFCVYMFVVLGGVVMGAFFFASSTTNLTSVLVYTCIFRHVYVASCTKSINVYSSSSVLSIYSPSGLV